MQFCGDRLCDFVLFYTACVHKDIAGGQAWRGQTCGAGVFCFFADACAAAAVADSFQACGCRCGLYAVGAFLQMEFRWSYFNVLQYSGVSAIYGFMVFGIIVFVYESVQVGAMVQSHTSQAWNSKLK